MLRHIGDSGRALVWSPCVLAWRCPGQAGIHPKGGWLGLRKVIDGGPTCSRDEDILKAAED
jgi:hypothetical protein